ncbi:MAG: nitroreductase family deazaflavin-dependent oxidoreductase [Promethearchaeota archaeon]|nr:MAG: nitroreductase family deazaflavin-dependent oxidoreductase [Candidatus Lokiarchaeota archaeon]
MSEPNQKKMNHDDLPRSGSVIYNFHYQDESSKKDTLKKWKKLNKYLVIPLYRSKILPLLGFGKIFLLLKTKGWKTGKIRRTPLEYRRYQEDIIIVSARGENAAWIKNMRAHPNHVEVTVGFHIFKPLIEFVSEGSQKLKIIKWYIAKYSKAAKMLFGWDPKNDDLETSNFENLVNLLTIVLLHKD